MYLEANNLYGWEMSEKFPVTGLKWKTDMSIFHKEFIKNFDQNSGKEYKLDLTIDYPKNLHDLHSDLQFFTRGNEN